MIPFTHSLFFKALAKPWLGVGLSLHHSQEGLSGPHRRSNRNPVAATLWSMVELKGDFLLFKILLSPWMLPPSGFEREKKVLCLSGGANGGGVAEDSTCFVMDWETPFSVSKFSPDK